MTAQTLAAPTERVDTADFSYVIRPSEERDLSDVVSYYTANEQAEPDPTEPENPTISELQRWWSDPRAKHNLWWVVRLLQPDGSEGRIIADCQFERKPGEVSAWSGFFVSKAYRNHGIGTRLYDMMAEMAQREGVTKLYSADRADRKLKQDFLTRRGFAIDRYFWQMRLPAETAVPPTNLPEGYTLRTFVPGQDEQLFMDVRNATFAEHFGSTPYEPGIVEHIIQQEDFQPEGLFFAFKGDEIAGYCWAGISAEEIAKRGIRVGWIHHLGTMPAHRGLGLGRALLLVGVQHLRQSVDIVELGMEGKNEKALNLYTSVGFFQYRAWLNMVKELRD